MAVLATGVVVLLLCTPAGAAAGPRAGGPMSPALAPPVASASPAPALSSPGSNLTWTNLTAPGAPAPSPRAGAAAVYDPALEGVLLFGGLTTHSVVNDTWMWRDGSWTDLTPTLSVAPSPRYDAAIAYDDALGAVILFGGYTGSTHLGDTWLFQNGAWTNLSPAVSPPAREDASIAYDPLDSYVVLFGGELQDRAIANDTWTFANDHWTNRTTPRAPPAREAGAMAYDPALSGSLLFGGVVPYVRALSDTWTYSQGHWTNLTGSVGTAPPPREKAAMAYDPTDGVLLLFDGTHGSNVLDSEWFFANGGWTAFQPALAPHSRYDAVVVWSPNAGTGLFLLFGGASSTVPLNDTWGLRPALSVVVSADPSALDVDQSSNVSATVSGGYPPFLPGWSGLPTGCTPSGWYARCTFSSPGTSQIIVTATDSHRAVASSSATVTVNPALGLSATVEPTTGPAPLSVNYSVTPSGGTAPLTYLWQFGDGTSSTAAFGTHVYTTPGTYNGTVTASDATTASTNRTFSVTVLSSSAITPLTAQVVANPLSGSAPLNVTFGGTATGGLPPYTFAWSFGDGASASGPSVTHSFAAGNFSVTLTVTDSQGNTTNAITDVTVGPALSVVGEAAATAACVQGSGVANVTYSVAIQGGTAPYQVTWDLGNGVTPVSGLEANATYPATGQYSANATVTDAQGHSVVLEVTATSSVPTGCGGTSSSSPGFGSYLGWILLVLAVVLIALVAVLWRRRSRPKS